MLRRTTCLLIIAFFLFCQVSCSPSQADILATEALYQAETQQASDAKSTRRALFTENARSTASVKETTLAQEKQIVEQTAAALNTAATVEFEATKGAIATSTSMHEATSTAIVVHSQTATANAITQATAQAQPMVDLVTRLHNEGYLTSTDGTFFSLPDFDESWAQLSWYWFFPTSFSPTDFVISAHSEWDIASDKPDPWATGCGFVFRENGIPNHYLIFLALDGNVYFSRYYKDSYDLIGSSYYGNVGIPQGSADIALAMEGSIVTFLVNGDVILNKYDNTLKSGNLDYTLISGTNKDYGTHCRMTNIELWVLK